MDIIYHEFMYGHSDQREHLTSVFFFSKTFPEFWPSCFNQLSTLPGSGPSQDKRKMEIQRESSRLSDPIRSSCGGYLLLRAHVSSTNPVTIIFSRLPLFLLIYELYKRIIFRQTDVESLSNIVNSWRFVRFAVYGMRLQYHISKVSSVFFFSLFHFQVSATYTYVCTLYIVRSRILMISPDGYSFYSESVLPIQFFFGYQPSKLLLKPNSICNILK